MPDVVRFPTKEETSILIGPFAEWRVVLKGRKIPRLTARQTSDGGIHFVVDERFAGGPFYGDAAHQVAYLLAQALAVGAGYADFEAERPGTPFASITMRLEKEPSAGAPAE